MYLEDKKVEATHCSSTLFSVSGTNSGPTICGPRLLWYAEDLQAVSVDHLSVRL